MPLYLPAKKTGSTVHVPERIPPLPWDRKNGGIPEPGVLPHPPSFPPERSWYEPVRLQTPGKPRNPTNAAIRNLPAACWEQPNASRPPVSGHPDPHRRTRTSNPCVKNSRKPTEKTSDGQTAPCSLFPRQKGDFRLPGQSLRPPSLLKGPAARRHPQTCPGCPRTAGGPGNPPFLRQLAMHSENGNGLPPEPPHKHPPRKYSLPEWHGINRPPHIPAPDAFCARQAPEAFPW